ncbi:MAG: DUF5916 domain-containing protein [Gemmatimonadaceae bacterium]
MLISLLSFALLLQSPAPAPVLPRDSTVYDGRSRQLDVAPPRIDTTVVVDGVLDEAVWRRAAKLTGFSQYRPVDGSAATDSTDVLVWYSSDAIYFGIRAFEPHGAVVRATLADRDNIDADDNIQILLDTYSDHRRAFMFAVNPLGVQEDGVRSEGQDAGAAGGGSGPNARFDGTIDLNPDFVWESRGHVTSTGYEIEVRIPFRSIRFQDLDPQTWGIQIVREVQHSGYEDTWTPTVRANASFLIQAGRLVGLTHLQRGLVLDLIPEATTKVEGDSVNGAYRYATTPALGGTMFWGVTNGLGLSATAHPDFSQVEADVAQVTLNQRFALFFPEKRPFFLEGLEQYDTPNRLIYTRDVVQPDAGAKLTGKIGDLNVAYLGAVDQRDSATGSEPVYNILRLRRDLGASSNLGLVYTDRIDGGDYNRVGGVDGRFLWHKIWFSQVQVVGSATRDSSGGRNGAVWDVTFGDRTGRAYGNHVELLGVSPDFVAASGFVNRTGFVRAMIFNRYTVYGKPGAFVEQVSFFLNAQPLWNYADFGKFAGTFEGGYSTQASATLRGGWNVGVNLNDNYQRFDSTAYRGYGVAGGADTNAFALPHGLYSLYGESVSLTSPNRKVIVNASAGYNDAVLFAEAGEGREITGSVDVAWRPTPLLRLDASWIYDRLSRVRDGSEFAITNIPRLQVEYQLTRSIFFRYIGQYVAQRQAPLEDPRTGQPLVQRDSTTGVYSALGAFASNEFRNDVLLSYKPIPGTVFFAGYGASLSEPNAFQFSRGMYRTTDGVFVKVSYLFRL